MTRHIILTWEKVTMEKCPRSFQITISLFYKRKKKNLSLVTIQLNYLVTVSHTCKRCETCHPLPEEVEESLEVQDCCIILRELPSLVNFFSLFSSSFLKIHT